MSRREASVTSQTKRKSKYNFKTSYFKLAIVLFMIVGLSNAEPLTQADSENTVKEYLNDHEDSLGTIYFFDSQDS